MAPRTDRTTSSAQRRLERLAEELADEGVPPLAGDGAVDLVLDELDYALHPRVHERRVPTYGAIISPVVDASRWEPTTRLHVTRRSIDDYSDRFSRRFADGLSSWALRQPEGITELLNFDRTVASERDLVVLSKAAGATVVQRHPGGTVRVVGPFGLARWDGVRWHHEPPLRRWIDSVTRDDPEPLRSTLRRLVEFAVYDLGARGIGALLVIRPSDDDLASWEIRTPKPPPLDIRIPVDMAPLHHVLAQTDGASIFDEHGVLRWLGVRLVPSVSAESDIDPFRGTRHTAGRRYSYDDPDATVIAVSEDGPVTMLRKGRLVARTPD